MTINKYFHLIRKYSCVNTRGIPTAAHQVLHMLSCTGGGGGTPEYPPCLDLAGVPSQLDMAGVHPIRPGWGTPPSWGTPWLGYPLPAGVPPGWGTPSSDLAGVHPHLDLAGVLPWLGYSPARWAPPCGKTDGQTRVKT